MQKLVYFEQVVLMDDKTGSAPQGWSTQMHSHHLSLLIGYIYAVITETHLYLVTFKEKQLPTGYKFAVVPPTLTHLHTLAALLKTKLLSPVYCLFILRNVMGGCTGGTY